MLFFQGTVVERITGLTGVRQKSCYPDSPPVDPDQESLAYQAAYTKVLLPPRVG